MVSRSEAPYAVRWSEEEVDGGSHSRHDFGYRILGHGRPCPLARAVDAASLQLGELVQVCRERFVDG
jgi:hypothetical protein